MADYPEPKPRRKRRREAKRQKRWGRAKAFDALSAGRQTAVRVIDLFEDALVVLSLGVLGFTVMAHMVLSQRAYLGFIALYEQLVRGYWFIERLESSEYGMWPGILQALFSDAIFMGVLMLVLTLPFALLRRQLFDDARSPGEVVSDTVTTTGFTLLVVYLVGAIVGTFIIIVVTGVAATDTPVEGLLAPVTSGIFVTDVVFSAALWWDDRATSPRAPNMRYRFVAGGGVAVGLFAVITATLPIEGHVDVGDFEDVTLYVDGPYVDHEGETVVTKVTDVTNETDFDEGEWTARGHLYAYGKNQPFFLSRRAFYRSPADDVKIEAGRIHFTYALHPFTLAPERRARTVALAPDPKGEFYDNNVVVTERADAEAIYDAFAVEVRAPKTTPEGLAWGLIAREAGGDALYVVVEDHRVKMLEVGSPLVELATHEAGGPVERLRVQSHHGAGITVFVDDAPIWVAVVAGYELGPAMIRRPKLRKGDRIEVQVTIDHARPAPADEVSQAMKGMTPLL